MELLILVGSGIVVGWAAARHVVLARKHFALSVTLYLLTVFALCLGGLFDRKHDLAVFALSMLPSSIITVSWAMITGFHRRTE